MTAYAPRAVAEVDLDAIAANVRQLRGVATGAEVMVVVKADGYGHGLVPAARAAQAGGASWLGTAVVEEALALRAAGVQGRILTWLAAPGESWDAALRAGVDVSAGAPWLVREVALAARRTGRAARLHLEADSGLSRGGAAGGSWSDLLEAALAEAADGAVQVVGLWSHLAAADEPGHPATAAQVGTFDGMLAEAARLGVRPEVRHLANSAATLLLPETHLDLVRVGIAAYGVVPAAALGPPCAYGLRPAMTLRARLVMVKRVRAGAGVSYGHTWHAPRDTVLGLVPLGYGDGVPRAASGRGPAQVAGERVRTVGRVCMDQFVVDLGPGSTAAAGEEIVLFGPGDDGEPLAEDWAAASGTIGYEIVTRISARVPRTYVGGSW